jgi:hypothetical protein
MLLWDGYTSDHDVRCPIDMTNFYDQCFFYMIDIFIDMTNSPLSIHMFYHTFHSIEYTCKPVISNIGINYLIFLQEFILWSCGL